MEERKAMNVDEGLGRIRKFWPGVKFQMAGAEDLDTMHKRLHEVSQRPEPGDLKELIAVMDAAGLGIRGDLVVLIG